MKGVVMDRSAPIELFQFFHEKGYQIVESCHIPQLYPAVRTHPDMQLCRINANTFISAPDCYTYYQTAMPNCKIIKGERPIACVYPGDAAYNAAVYGKIAFHSENCIDPVVKQYFLGNDIHFIPVKQGYSKCNTCFLSETSLITSDHSIQKEAEKWGIQVLKIQNSPKIELKEFAYGFIGGATGRLSSDELIVCGDIKIHPDYQAIHSFCYKNRVKITSAYRGSIIDIGSILEFED